TTPKPGDSGQHREVSKNGKDHVQDREIQALVDQAQQHHEEFIAFTKQDLSSHVALDKTIQGVQNTIEKYQFTGKVLWGVAGLVYTALVSGVGWLLAEVGQIDDNVRDLGAEMSRTEATDASLRSDIEHVEQDLRELRRLVQSHQINKSEHLRSQKDE
ncbi:MAG: hypothetical protein OEU26_00095, partial [Candidatus Tectomicrobia bacterium]|nr:hypothetical protein [Candidatus Tectomicrobia bacterium]